MKRIGKGMVLALGMSLAFGSAALAAEAGTYVDEKDKMPLVIEEDLSFHMEQVGHNMEGEEFTLLVTGTFAKDGTFKIEGLYDGDINLIEMASEEQLKDNIAQVQRAYDAGLVKEEGLPGTYKDEESGLTLVIEDDLTFHMEQVGHNMEGEEFTLLVTGTFAEDGTFKIEGLYDGEINLIEMASEEQLKDNIAQIQKTFDAGKVKAELVPGTYTDGEHELVLAEDRSFAMDKTGKNMEGTEFVLHVVGTITEDGEITITGLFDGDINLVEMASEEQLAGDIQTVKDTLAGGLKDADK